MISTLNRPNGLVFSNKEKANVLAENSEKAYHLTERDVNKTFTKAKNTRINVDKIIYVSPREVKKAIPQT